MIICWQQAYSSHRAYRVTATLGYAGESKLKEE
jgi:hypothetical protein